MNKVIAPCGLCLNAETMGLDEDGNVTVAQNIGPIPSYGVEFLNLGQHNQNQSFNITEEESRKLFSETPPIVQMIVGNYNITMYRFDKTESDAYYSNLMYLSGRKYYMTMVVRGTRATISSANEYNIPAVTDADNGKVLKVVNGKPTWV